MAFNMNFDVITKTPTAGKAVGMFVGFYAEPTNPSSMIEGAGKVVVQTVVKNPTTGEYNEPSDENEHIIELDMLPAVGRTYCGGTITGAQVLQAISEMCELGWDGTLPRKGA